MENSLKDLMVLIAKAINEKLFYVMNIIIFYVLIIVMIAYYLMNYTITNNNNIIKLEMRNGMSCCTYRKFYSDEIITYESCKTIPSISSPQIK